MRASTITQELKPRQSTRYRVKVSAVLFEEDGDGTRTYTVTDVSRGGMCLNGPSVVQVGSRVRVWLECGDRTVALAGAVVWTATTRCGVAFSGDMGIIGASVARYWSEEEPETIY
jgi:hypothetical protein